MDQSSSSFVDADSKSFLNSVGGVLNQSSSSFVDGTNAAYSHGTLCAGIIAVVAPDSMIMPLRVFDDQGSADLFVIAKAIRYAAQQGAQVINMSFGTFENSQAIKSSISFAQSKNIMLVASAGNNNTVAPQYPAAYSGVLTTAATDLFDKKSSFSNYGSAVVMDAPGVNIFSAYPGGQYSAVSGTSFSAPIIAGTAALVRSLSPTSNASSITGAAINIDAKNPQYARQLGYGRIDVLRAVKP
jgi:subtilisin family serine protease